MREISLEMAQELGLVPKADLFDHGKWETRLSSEGTYRRRVSEIVDRYCFDKELRLCDYDALLAKRPEATGGGKP